MKRTAPAVSKAQKGKRKKTFKTAEKHEEAFELPAPEIPEEQLFVIDKKGDASVKPTTDTWRAKPLKTELVLAALTGKTGLEKPKKHKPKRSREIVPHSPAQRPARPGVADLWAESEAPKPPPSKWEEHWIPATQAEREALQSKRRSGQPLYTPPAAAAAGLTDARSLSNGLSYRPDRESHQDALGEAVAHETRLQAEADRVDRALRVRRSLPDDAAAESETLAQMVQFVRGGMRVTAGTGEEAPEEKQEEEEGEERHKGPKSKKGKKRKVDAVRKRSRREKRKARLGKQIERLGLIVREVDKESEQKQREDAAREEQRLLHRGDTRRVGRNKFQPSRPAVLLESDLPSSLRTMGNDKPLQGNRVAEVFESLQRRNMIPVTKRQPKHKRHPVKRFERPSDKQNWARIEQQQFGEFL